MLPNVENGAVMWTYFESKQPAKLHGLVFSPSGQWGIDVKRQGLRDGSHNVCIVDMSTLVYKYYKLVKLGVTKRLVDIYWISEFEVVLVDYSSVNKDAFHQVYCHVDHDKCCLIPFRGNYIALPNNVVVEQIVPSNHQTEPVYYQGKKYHLITKGLDLFFVPHNAFYGNKDHQTLHLKMNQLQLGTRFESFDVTFSYGSKLYIPVIEINVPTGIYRSSIHFLGEIDLNRIKFVDGYATLVEHTEAVSYKRLDTLNEILLEKTMSIKYRQAGNYLLAYTLTPSDEIINILLRSIFVIDLRNMTIGCTNIVTRDDYFPTVYRDQLLVIESDRPIDLEGFGKWKNRFTMKPLVKSQVSKLTKLTQAANVRYNTLTLDPVLIPFVFPQAHCCPQLKECFCQGILKSEYAEKHNVRESIDRLM